MSTLEAFRISLGSLKGERLLEHSQKKTSGLREVIETLLAPLHLADRLHFYRDSDRQEDKDWLIVKIEASGQLPLLEQIEHWGRDDQELGRECTSALDLARATLSVLRKLTSVARMAPYQFHEIIQQNSQLAVNSLRLAQFADVMTSAVVLRDPKGNDDFVLTPAVPRRATIPEYEEISFGVISVGRTFAMIRKVNGPGRSGRPAGREIALHWGQCADRSNLAKQFFLAMEEKRLLTMFARETVNARGRVEVARLV